jgi:chloride channel 3/4/5
LVTALVSDRNTHGNYLNESKGSIYPDDRVWYDQFTSTDWVHDSIADAYRVKALRARRDFWGRLYAFFDGSQGWILSALVGCITATIAYLVDICEPPVFDFKEGYCSDGWYKSERVSGAFWIEFEQFADTTLIDLLSEWTTVRRLAIMG